MTMHKAFYLRDNINRLCQEKEELEDWLTLKNELDASIWKLKYHIKMSKERLITAASNTTDNTRIEHQQQQKLGNRSQKKILWIFQATNWQNLTVVDLGVILLLKSERSCQQPGISESNNKRIKAIISKI